MNISWSHNNVRPILSSDLAESLDQNLNEGLIFLNLPKKRIMLTASSGRFTARILKYDIAMIEDDVSPAGSRFITIKMITLDKSVRRFTSPDF